MYTDRNFSTKKALKEAVKSGDKVTYFHPGGMGLGTPVTEGQVAIEGPHYPEPHKWYANCKVSNGIITEVK